MLYNIVVNENVKKSKNLCMWKIKYFYMLYVSKNLLLIHGYINYFTREIDIKCTVAMWRHQVAFSSISALYEQKSEFGE